MYEILCEQCGRVGVHPSGLGAELRAEHHLSDTGHPCHVEPLVTV